MPQLQTIPPDHECETELAKRTRFLRKKFGRGSRKNDFLDSWKKTGFAFDRQRAGEFIKDAQAAKQLTNEALAEYLDYRDGSSISRAISGGSFSVGRFHRLLSDCFEHFEAIDPCEAPTAAFMFVMTQIGKLDSDVNKRRFTRDVYVWLELLFENTKLLKSLINNGKDDTSQDMFQALTDSVHKRLKEVVVQSAELKKGAKYPDFLLRNLRTKDRVAFQWEDVRKVVWEWCPSFIVFEEVVVECNANYRP